MSKFLLPTNKHWLAQAMSVQASIDWGNEKVFTDYIKEIYHMGFWLSPAVSTRDPVIRPKSFSSRVVNGRGLIQGALTKTPCYDLFITYLNRYFEIIFIGNSGLYLTR